MKHWGKVQKKASNKVNDLQIWTHGALLTKEHVLHNFFLAVLEFEFRASQGALLLEPLRQPPFLFKLFFVLGVHCDI
jgi:hypothetical protein